MLPRIYTYKITFPGTPYFYWGLHKEKSYGEEYSGSPVSRAWVWEFYEHEKQVLEEFDTWEEGKQVEDRLILPDLNNFNCLNEATGFFYSLETCRKGGIAAVKRAQEEGFGFYGPKTQKQLESSREHSKHLREYSKDNGSKTGRDNVEKRRGIFSLSKEQREENSSKAGKKGGKITGSQRWKDPDHPELGEKPACVLVQMQRRRGYPSEPENRTKV